MSADTIGMMEGAFFVGRGELLAWINETFGVHIITLITILYFISSYLDVSIVKLE
jgi:hypothetical protein